MELFAIGVVMVAAPVVIQARSWRVRKDATAVERIMRALTSSGFGLAFPIGGAALILGAPGALYWIAAGDILCLMAVVLSAWVLMIEILR